MIEMNIITVLLLLFTAIYIVSALYLLMQRHPRQVNAAAKYKISVLLAVRNEENYLLKCLQSLSNQDYDQTLYDVFILDDNSDDNSAVIAQEFCKDKQNFHYTKIENRIAGLNGKMNVLAQGLKEQNCDLILITDADCIIQPTWISAMASYFDEKTGLVSALTSLAPMGEINPGSKEKLFHKVQALDWFFLQAVARLSSNAGKPVTVLGNNFAFNLNAYQQTGGFEKIGFSITEDYALLRAIEETEQWTIKHINDARAAIFSYPLDTFGEFFLQRLRWIKGGRSANVWAYFLMTTSFIAHFFILAAMFINPVNIFTILSLLSILLTDYLIIKSNIKQLGLNGLKVYFILFELFYIFYTLLFSLYFLFPVKVSWKGRKL